METAIPTPDQQQQESSIYQVSASGQELNHGSGSVGPFFAVVSVILVLAVLSCILGRVCGSRLEGDDAKYDCSTLGCGRFCAIKVLGPDIRYDCLDWFRRRSCRCIKNDAVIEQQAC